MTTADRAATKPEDVALAYLDALQRKDLEAICSILTDDFVLEVPNNISGANDTVDRWQGIDVASAGYAWAFEVIEVSKYVDVEVNPSTDPNVVFIEALGDMVMANGRPYKNRYVFRFDLVDGKIRRVREYLNPVTSTAAFDRPFEPS